MVVTSVLKLGGSIITDKKSGRPLLRTRRIREIAHEIARVRSKKRDLRLILLHGAGSFAHPLAHRYRLLDRALSADALEGVGHTILATRELGNHLCGALLNAGIPAVPLQTSSFMRVRRGRLYFTNFSILETILNDGGIPLLGGDVVFSDKARTAIASADGIAVLLAKKLKKTRMYFASDTDGVYASFPPRKGEHSLATLDRAGIKSLLENQSLRAVRTDVTGAMLGKLLALLGARDTVATIFNGNTRGVLADVLLGKKRGTRVVL